MNILYIHQYFATLQGHSGTRSYEQARAMIKAGHSVTMLTSSAQLGANEIPAGKGVIRRGTMEGIKLIVLVIPYEHKMDFANRCLAFAKFMMIASWVALREPDIQVIFATSTPLTVGVPALLAKLTRGRPFAFEVRDLWPTAPVALGVLRSRVLIQMLVWLERACYLHASFVVAVNEDVALPIRQIVQGRHPVIIVPNACDTTVFGKQAASADFRRRYDLVGKVVCVHAGTMGRVNGCEAIIDAAASLRAQAGLEFVFVGDGSERPSLERRAKQQGLMNVRFLPPMPKHELAAALASLDIGLMTVAPIPVLEWNSANKFFDYLASGLPVVLNYGGWQAPLLEQHGCGLSAAQGDVVGFTQAIGRLAANHELRQRMGRNARSLAEKELDRLQVLLPLERALADLADREGITACPDLARGQRRK